MVESQGASGTNPDDTIPAKLKSGWMGADFSAGFIHDAFDFFPGIHEGKAIFLTEKDAVGMRVVFGDEGNASVKFFRLLIIILYQTIMSWKI